MKQKSSSSLANSAEEPTHSRQLQNSPYCLKCFDRVFGETCAECGKLITCDSGAINHEQRCWHASPTCFKCFRCSRSLLGSPFLPSSDGHIYCSIQCSEQKSLVSSQQQQQQQLSLPHYSDPRAPQGAIQHALEGATNNNNNNDNNSQRNETAMNAMAAHLFQNSLHHKQQQQQQGIMRHKPLIDYLLTNARIDETSLQLLDYLYGQFQRQANSTEGHSEQLVKQIGDTLRQIESERNKNKQAANNKNQLNPFLIDSDVVAGQCKQQQQQQQMVVVGSLMMDGTQQNGHTSTDKLLANYMNLACVESSNNNKSTESDGQLNAAKQQQQQPVDSVDNGSVAHQRVTDSISSRSQQQQQKHLIQHQVMLQKQPQFAFKASQCSPVASLISNEGTISDHSATSSGVSTAPPAGSASGSLKSHSPLSSASSQDSSHTVSSASGSISSMANSVSIGHHQRLPLGSMNQNQRVVLPNNPIKGDVNQQQVSSIAATLERRRRVQPITELSVADLLSVADDQMHQHHSNRMDVAAFDQLVSHFDDKNRKQQQQQQQRGQLAAGQRQPESFFHELAQRLPKAATPARPASEQRVGVAHSPAQWTGPLDTNGLPTIESGSRLPTTITDHYSTVNKASKHQNQQHQLVNGNQHQSGLRDSFFAVTSPLLACDTSGHQPLRPSSSLSVQLATAPTTSSSSTPQLHASYSTSSLSYQQVAPENSIQQTSSCNKQQTLTRPTKSVSFDPTVKDPPSSSSSMTLGRASALKSALKSSAVWQHQQQQQQQLLHQHQNLMSTSATMPPELAGQLKAAAYSAHYDEHGRRIRLSSLLQYQQQQQPPLVDCSQEQQTTTTTQSTGSRSLLSGALSKLSLTNSTHQTSRGGRREERQMRQAAEQQLTIQTSQPVSLGVGAGAGSGSGSHQQVFVPPQQQQPSSSGAKLERSTSKRTAQSRRSNSEHRRSRRCSNSSSSSFGRGRRPKSSSRRHRHSSSSSWRHRRSSRYCNRSGCTKCDNESEAGDFESDASSRCSTCSESESDLSHSDDPYDSYDDSSMSSSSSTTSFDSDDDSISSRSYTSYSGDSDTASVSSSCSSSQCSSRASSPNSKQQQPADSSKRTTNRHRRSSNTGSGSGSSRHRTSKRQQQRSRASKRRNDRAHSSRRTSSSSSRHSVSNRSNGSSSTASRSSSRKMNSSRHHRSNAGQRSQHQHQHQHQHQQRSHHHSTRRDRQEANHCESRPSSSSAAAAAASSSLASHRDHHQQHRRSSSTASFVSHLQPEQPMIISLANDQQQAAQMMQQQQQVPPTNMNFYCPQVQPATVNSQANMRAKSPSSLSNDSKSIAQNGNENCRII